MSLLNVAQIIIALMVIGVILIQVRGGGLGGIFGGSGESAFRTRRGVERTLFRFTIVLVVVFIILSILSVRFV
ncbi:MAG: preprotein translocase subunit SecG [Dehalococcoidia bacterium]|jgi:preprotein translocase subunit SecG|nr:MAG: preprotein translocase subunit SecG [Dehalococcoidia bacterium]